MNKSLYTLSWLLAFLCVTTVTINNKLSMIIAPYQNQTITTQFPTIIGVIKNKKNNSKKEVTIYIDGVAIAIVKAKKGIFTYTVRQDRPLSSGQHFVYAVTTKENLYIKGSIFTVEPQTLSPFKAGNVSASTSYIAYPFDGAFVGTDTPYIVSVVHDASDDPVSGENLNYKMDSTTVATNRVSDVSGTSFYYLTSGQQLSDGSHTVDAHAVQSNVDLTQNSFTIDTQSPDAPTITSPTDNQTVNSNTVIVTGTTEPDASVTVFMDGDTYGEITTADGTGAWSIQFNLANGPHFFTAIATDVAFNESDLSNEVDFTVSA